MPRLLLATTNKGKAAEYRDLLEGLGFELVTLDKAGISQEADESYNTFEENARHKAAFYAELGGLLTLADDSGLEVVALNNAPGVYSARYAGEPCSYPANNDKLLRALAGTTDRRARFRCVIALCAPDGREWTVDGSCEGRILEGEPRGVNGFGYDPLFVPDGFEQTFAELSGEVKNGISHRGRALRLASAEWHALLA